MNHVCVVIELVSIGIIMYIFLLRLSEQHTSELRGTLQARH